MFSFKRSILFIIRLSGVARLLKPLISTINTPNGRHTIRMFRTVDLLLLFYSVDNLFRGLTAACILFFSFSVAAKIHYIHTDHLGTPIAMTDEQQIITWQAEYRPFGKADVDPASTVELNLRFPGQYYDKESGLHYNYYRDYDAITGRYIQSDPIGLAGGINTYGYALNNPLRYVDPLGLWVKRCARALDALDKLHTPMRPRGNPLRHDYLSVSGSILSFQAGDSMLWSRGRIDREGELPDNPKCTMICEDDKFDKYVFEAATEIGEPTYCIIPGVLGARNCQTWASDVLDLAKKKYLEGENCPQCFGGGSSGGGQPFSPNFGRAL